MVKLTLVTSVALLICSLLSAQTYELANDVLDDGGTKMTSTGYILEGSFGQPTIGKISSSSYIAYIGFWHPPYAPGPGVEEGPLKASPAPMVFDLSQNYPNPFARTTHIRYTVPGSRGAGPALSEVEGAQGRYLSTYQRINLSVYDLSGRLVRILVDEEQEPGYYSVSWDVGGVSREGLPNGVYFCRLEAGNSARTRKMVVLR